MWPPLPRPAPRQPAQGEKGWVRIGARAIPKVEIRKRAVWPQALLLFLFPSARLARLRERPLASLDKSLYLTRRIAHANLLVFWEPQIGHKSREEESPKRSAHTRRGSYAAVSP